MPVTHRGGWWVVPVLALVGFSLCAEVAAARGPALRQGPAAIVAAPPAPPAQQEPETDTAGRGLIEAVKAGDTAAARALLRQGTDVDVRAVDDATALHWAAHRDDLGRRRSADSRRRQRAGDQPVWQCATRAGVPQRQRGDDRKAVGRGRGPQRHPARSRDGADDRGAQRRCGGSAGAAGPWRGPECAGELESADGIDVGRGREQRRRRPGRWSRLAPTSMLTRTRVSTTTATKRETRGSPRCCSRCARARSRLPGHCSRRGRTYMTRCRTGPASSSWRP